MSEPAGTDVASDDLIADETVEVAARAICVARGSDPDTLYQHYEHDDYPTDHTVRYKDLTTGLPREQILHFAWRNHVAPARAAIEAVSNLHLARISRAPITEAVAIERCAAVVDDFQWTLPLYGDRPSGFTAADVNMLIGDCACAVQEQIAAAIRKLAAHPLPQGEAGPDHGFPGDPVGPDDAEIGMSEHRSPGSGDTDELVERADECSIDGCTDASFARGWCRKHYMRWFRRGKEGDPTSALEASLAAEKQRNTELERDAVDADKLADSIQAKLETVWNKHVAAKQRVVELTAERDEARVYQEHFVAENEGNTGRVERLTASLAAAETQMRAKDEALKPFADIAATLDNGLIPQQYDNYLITTTLGLCRAAFAALAPGNDTAR